MVEKVIRSALANAEQNVEVDLDSLYLSRAIVDEGPLLGGRSRWRPISRGRAVSILKKTCHIKITLSEMAAEEAAVEPAGEPAGDAASEAAADEKEE
jgi:large subunit ribosomal protein L22